MGTLNYNYRIETHIKSKNLKTFKMHGFEPQNMFTFMNSMMNDPEIQKFAKNFEEQMKNSMEEFKKSKNNETSNTTEKSCPSSSSSPKTTENGCSSPKTKNASACPMFSTRMCNPRKNNRNSSPNSVSIPLRRFTPEQVQLNMNKNGLVTVTASRENTEESNRNGQRKTTILVEETCQLPGYLVDHGLLNCVQSKYHNGFLVLTFAEDPKVLEEREAEERKHTPIEIPILMEE